MQELIKPVQDYLNKLIAQQLSPAYLLTKDNGELLDAGGALDFFGLSDLIAGNILSEHLLAMEGIFPLGKEQLHLPLMRMENGKTADMHFFPDPNGIWILFLDASQDAGRQELLQQKANELALLRRQYQKLTAEE